MLSLIVSLRQPLVFQRFLEPAIAALGAECQARGEPFPELIVVRGSKSIAENYNRGLRRAQFAIKAYIHEDVHITGTGWAFTARDLFARHPDLALLGLVGGRVLPDRGYWWDTGAVENRVGGVLATKYRAYWGGATIDEEWSEVACIDGCVMISRDDMPWDEAIPGFHCYDMDYCRALRAAGRRIGVFAHPAWHIGAKHCPAEMQASLEAYERKWAACHD